VSGEEGRFPQLMTPDYRGQNDDFDWVHGVNHEDKTVSNYIPIDDAGPIPDEELEEAERLGNEAAQRFFKSGEIPKTAAEE
jgi:hypothetical protein